MRGSKEMKITGTSSYIEIEWGDRVVFVEGEMVVGGFVAYKSSMRWKEPFENEELGATQKDKIIQAVIDKTKASYMIITFE